MKLHELISLGFVKAYVENPDIAKITSNQITAITKGKTKLVLIYGTQLLECDIIISQQSWGIIVIKVLIWLNIMATLKVTPQTIENKGFV